LSPRPYIFYENAKVNKGCISLLTSWTTEDVIVLHCFQAYVQGMFYSQSNTARWDTVYKTDNMHNANSCCLVQHI